MGDQPRWPRGTPGGGHVPGPGPGRWRPERNGNRGRHGGTPGTPDWADRVSGRIRGHGSGGPDDTSHLSTRDFRDVVPESDPGSDREVMWRGAVRERLQALGHDPDEVEAELDEEGFLGELRLNRDADPIEYADSLVDAGPGQVDRPSQDSVGAVDTGQPGTERAFRETVMRQLRQTAPADALDGFTDEHLKQAVAQARADWEFHHPTGTFRDFAVDQIAYALHKFHPDELWPQG